MSEKKRISQRKSKKVKPTSYEKCKKNIIGKDMRLFKQGKLELRNKQPVTSRKQAIAIALSMAERKCKDKRTSVDKKRDRLKLKSKLRRDVYKESIHIIDIKKAILRMKEYKKMNRYTALRTLQLETMSRILMAFPPYSNKPVSNIILRDIQNYILNI